MKDRDLEEQARGRQRRLEDEDRARREVLLREVEGLALDFPHQPEQIGYYLAEHVKLRPGDVDRIEQRLLALGGEPFVARAFAAAGFISAPDALPADAEPAVWPTGPAPELYDSVRTACIGEAIRAEWARPSRDVASPRGEAQSLMAPRPGSWADVHGQKRRQLAAEVRAEWREAAARAGAREDRDSELTRRTRGLVGELAPKLGLDPGSVEVVSDSGASRRLRPLEADGLVDERGVVHVDPGIFDGRSPQSRELLGHELAHVAQKRAQGPTAPAERLEAEADRAGEALAVGGRPVEPLSRMSETHRAARTKKGRKKGDVKRPPSQTRKKLLPSGGTALELALHFFTDSAELGKEELAALRDAAGVVRQYHERLEEITVDGYADERGRRDYNWKLAQRRVFAVVAALRRAYTSRSSRGLPALVVHVHGEAEGKTHSYWRTVRVNVEVGPLQGAPSNPKPERKPKKGLEPIGSKGKPPSADELTRRDSVWRIYKQLIEEIRDVLLVSGVSEWELQYMIRILGWDPIDVDDHLRDYQNEYWKENQADTSAAGKGAENPDAVKIRLYMYRFFRARYRALVDVLRVDEHRGDKSLRDRAKEVKRLMESLERDWDLGKRS